MLISLIEKLTNSSVLLVRVKNDEEKRTKVQADGNISNLLDAYTFLLPILLKEINLKSLSTNEKDKELLIKNLATELLINTLINLEDINVNITPEELVWKYKHKKNIGD
jgi:hypothetical protein